MAAPLEFLHHIEITGKHNVPKITSREPRETYIDSTTSNTATTQETHTGVLECTACPTGGITPTCLNDFISPATAAPRPCRNVSSSCSKRARLGVLSFKQMNCPHA